MTKKTAATLALVSFVAVLALLFIMMVAPAHGATSSTQKHNNGLGFKMYQENPNQYLMGYVSNGEVGKTRADRRVVVLEIRPTNTYSMFSQSFAFCDITEEQVDKFADGSVVVFTFSKVMHHAECYDLYRVDRVGK
jgi:hypothetical protein